MANTGEHLDEVEEDSHVETEELRSHFNKFQLLDSDVEAETSDAIYSDYEAQSSDTNHDEVGDVKIAPTNVKPPKSHKNNRNKRRTKKKQSKQKLESEGQVPFQSSEPNQVIKPQAEPPNLHLKLLKLDLKFLNPENEIRRLFGRTALEEERVKEVKLRGHRVQRSRFASAGYSGPVGSIPKMVLEDRPQTTGSKMKSDEINQSDWFRFVHNKAYQTAQSLFMAAVQAGNSEAVIHNINLNPTHIESLLQASDMMYLSENYQEASSLIERALLIFEREFHPKFNLMQANARLDYKRPENRTFFITLFKLIVSCNRRGLRRTPLEYTKLLLSLDPESDPLFAALMIDFFAIRSEDYDFLIEFASKWKQLARLPNLKLSLALAYFMKSQNLKFGKQACQSNLKLADESLQEALLRYPNFIVALLEECSAEPGEMKKCEYFDYSVYGLRYKTVPESIELLTTIYVKRASFLWKFKKTLAWLGKNVTILVDKFTAGELKDEGQNLEYWSDFRGPVPRNLLRHVVLSDLKVKLPVSVSKVSTLDIDPFPPTNSIVSYQFDLNPQGESSTTGSNGNSSFGLPGLFLRSLLPNFNQASQPDQAAIHPSGPVDDQLDVEIEHEFNRRANMLLDEADTPVERQNVLASIQMVLRSLGLVLSQADEQLTANNSDSRNLDRNSGNDNNPS